MKCGLSTQDYLWLFFKLIRDEYEERQIITIIVIN